MESPPPLYRDLFVDIPPEVDCSESDIEKAAGERDTGAFDLPQATANWFRRVFNMIKRRREENTDSFSEAACNGSSGPMGTSKLNPPTSRWLGNLFGNPGEEVTGISEHPDSDVDPETGRYTRSPDSSPDPVSIRSPSPVLDSLQLLPPGLFEPSDATDPVDNARIADFIYRATLQHQAESEEAKKERRKDLVVYILFGAFPGLCMLAFLICFSFRDQILWPAALANLGSGEWL